MMTLSATVLRNTLGALLMLLDKRLCKTEFDTDAVFPSSVLATR